MGLATLNNIVEKTDTLTDGLVGYWPLNEGKDNIVYDYSGNKNNGFSSVKQNWDVYAYFNGIVNTITIISKPILSFGVDSFSILLWVKVYSNVGNWDTVFHKGGASAASIGCDIELGNTLWDIGISDGTTRNGVRFFNSVPTPSNWIHLAGVINRETSKFYGFANGSLPSISSNPVDITSFGSIKNNTNISISQTSLKYNGLIKDLRIYNRALSPFEIKKLYNLGLSNIQNTRIIV